MSIYSISKRWQYGKKTDKTERAILYRNARTLLRLPLEDDPYAAHPPICPDASCVVAKALRSICGRGQELAAQCFGAGGGDQFPEDNTPPLPVVDLPVSPGYADLLQPGLPQNPGADRRKILYMGELFAEMTKLYISAPRRGTGCHTLWTLPGGDEPPSLLRKYRCRENKANRNKSQC